MLEPAVRQEELPAVEPEVLAELVEQHEPEMPVTLALTCLLLLSRRVLLRPLLVLLGRPVLLLLVLLGRLEARTSVAAGSNGDNLPLLVLHLQVLALRVERAVNQMVEVVEAEVEQRVLEVVLKTLHEVLLLLAVIRNLGRGVASKLQKTITILRDRHSPLK